MSRVDVIVPCYNYAHFLRGCVESVLGQGGVDVRVLIIDDASPDRTAEVAAELANADHRVEFRRHATNRGHIATYNSGLEWCDGDYTVLLSADDLLAPNSLARATKLLDDHPEVVMAHGRGIVFTTADPPPFRAPMPGDCAGEIRGGVDFLESFCVEGGNLVCTPTAIVRTSTQKKIGGYRPELPHAGDMEMWMRFAAHGDVGALDADQAYYRVHPANMSRPWYETDVLDFRQRKLAFEVLFRDQGGLIRDRVRLEQLANRSLCMNVFWAASKALEDGDMTRYSGLITLALETDPGLRARPEYARLRWKLRLGPRAFSALRPLVEFARARRDRPVKSL